MASLNWPEQKKNKLEREASSSKRVTREAGQEGKAAISTGVVLCSRCKCETKLEIILDKQKQPAPSTNHGINRTRRRRIQRQYWTFLKSKEGEQVREQNLRDRRARECGHRKNRRTMMES
ncbi:unnamed protein product [Prunus brigantina]